MDFGWGWWQECWERLCGRQCLRIQHGHWESEKGKWKFNRKHFPLCQWACHLTACGHGIETISSNHVALRPKKPKSLLGMGRDNLQPTTAFNGIFTSWLPWHHQACHLVKMGDGLAGDSHNREHSLAGFPWGHRAGHHCADGRFSSQC